MRLPTLVPTRWWIPTRFSSSTFKTPMWARPRANPPPNASARRGCAGAGAAPKPRGRRVQRRTCPKACWRIAFHRLSFIVRPAPFRLSPPGEPSLGWTRPVAPELPPRGGLTPAGASGRLPLVREVAPAVQPPAAGFASSMLRLQTIAVLGAGVMGARIAAHLANAGLQPILLDIVPRELTEEEKQRGLTLASPAVRNRAGNFDDHLEWLREADWIIEAVAERLEVKQALLARVEAVRRPGAIVSSNTSGLPLQRIAEGRSEDFRRHWLGTHFFNPPRYMRLVEVIPTADTRPEVVEAISDFCDRRLGKLVVRAKDTPNFIANRIGTFSMLNVLRLMQEDGLTVEQVDELTGPVAGFPRSATFRTADLVGLDVLAHVVANLRDNLPDDERRELFVLPDFIQKMIERGWLGEKSGQGFYKRVKEKGESQILALDWKTLDYRPRQKAGFPPLELARNTEDLGERLRLLLNAPDALGRFYQRLVDDLFHYSALRVPEIADSIVDVDQALRYGFNWERGPFELWHAGGVEPVVERWRTEKRPLPPLVEALTKAKQHSFYLWQDNPPFFFDFARARHKFIPERPGIILLKDRRTAGAVVRTNPGASLVDLGDGVACLEFHSKMNTIGPDILQMVDVALEQLQAGFEALVVGNQGPHFSAGANIMFLLVAAQDRK